MGRVWPRGKVPDMISYFTDERLDFQEYVEFLTRTDLGEQYQTLRFRERIAGLLANASVCVTARADRLIGVSLAITDWNYFVFLTDLGVDREYVGSGIGRTLVQLTIDCIGPAADLTVITLSNEDAVPFYRKQGLAPDDQLLVRYCENWDSVNPKSFL